MFEYKKRPYRKRLGERLCARAPSSLLPQVLNFVTVKKKQKVYRRKRPCAWTVVSQWRKTPNQKHLGTRGWTERARIRTLRAAVGNRCWTALVGEPRSGQWMSRPRLTARSRPFVSQVRLSLRRRRARRCASRRSTGARATSGIFAVVRALRPTLIEANGKPHRASADRRQS